MFRRYTEERKSESESEYYERKHGPIARRFDGVCRHYTYDSLTEIWDIRSRCPNTRRVTA